MLVSPPVQIDSIRIDAIDASIGERRKEAKTAISSGIELLELEEGTMLTPAASTESTETNVKFVRVVYRHFVTAVDERKQPFFHVSVVVSSFLRVDRDVYPISPEANPVVLTFLDHVFALLMPYSAQKLRLLCFEMGISPEPPIELFPTREQDSDVAQAPDDA